MLSIFPALLTYEMLAPFLLRVILGIFLVWNSYKILKSGDTHMPARMQSIGRIISMLYGISGALLVIGLFTQLAAVVVVVLTLPLLVYTKMSSTSTSSTPLMPLVFVVVIALSLMFSGAGFYAIDLPL